MEAVSPHDVQSSIWFLENSDVYNTIKPYHLTFTPANGVARTNIKRSEVKDILIRDLRSSQTPSFDKNGFVVLNLKNPLVPEVCDDLEILKEFYFNDLEIELKKMFPGSTVAVLQYRVSILNMPPKLPNLRVLHTRNNFIPDFRFENVIKIFQYQLDKSIPILNRSA